MNKSKWIIRYSPNSITLVLIGLVLISRLLSEHAFSTGTMCILLFWTGMLVILPDYVEGYESKKLSFFNFPWLTKLLVLTIVFISISTFFWRENIYGESTFYMDGIRRSIYLIHPLICFCWFQLVKEQKIKFLLIITLLTAMFFMTLVGPKLINESTLVVILNKLTSFLASNFSSLFINEKIYVEGIFFYSESFRIKVGSGCSSMPQMFLSFFCILVFYLCCKVSKISLVIVLLSSIFVVFFSNSIRIAILALVVREKKLDLFDFWHDGLGSLIFSFIIMTINSFVYYFLWNKENT